MSLFMNVCEKLKVWTSPRMSETNPVYELLHECLRHLKVWTSPRVSMTDSRYDCLKQTHGMNFSTNVCDRLRVWTSPRMSVTDSRYELLQECLWQTQGINFSTNVWGRPSVRTSPIMSETDSGYELLHEYPWQTLDTDLPQISLLVSCYRLLRKCLCWTQGIDFSINVFGKLKCSLPYTCSCGLKVQNYLYIILSVHHMSHRNDSVLIFICFLHLFFTKKAGVYCLYMQ